MKEYFLSLIALTFVGGGILMLAPEGGTKSGIRLICSLCAISCILLPLSSFFEGNELDANDVTAQFAYKDESEMYYDEIYNSSLTSASLKNIEISLKTQIISAFKIKSKDFDIKLNAVIKSDEYSITSATLILHASGIATDPKPICKYISELLKCECDVYYEK